MTYQMVPSSESAFLTTLVHRHGNAGDGAALGNQPTEPSIMNKTIT